MERFAVNDALVLDLLDWLSGGEKDYAEIMEAWRSSCPRLTIWEDAMAAGWLRRRSRPDGARVGLTDLGRAWLEDHRDQSV